MRELIDSFRRAIKRRASKTRKPLAPGEDGDLCVGILGMGHVGKQLLLSLLEKTDIKPSHIKISTRRPELTDWQRGQMFSFFAVCPLTSQMSALISAPIFQSAALCTVSPLLFPSPDVWQSCPCVAEGLSDPLLTEASCPLTVKDGISLGLNWVCAVLYSLLNLCTSSNLGSSEALSLINFVFKEKWAN